MPGPRSRRSRGTRRGRSSGAPPGSASATRVGLVGRPAAAWSSRSSTSRSRRASRPTGTSPTGWSRSRSGRWPSAASRSHDDGTPLVVVDIETELEFSVAEVDRRDRRHRHRVRRPRRLRDRRRDVRQARRGDHPRRDRAGRGRQPRHRAALPRGGRRLGRRQGADRLPPAARARARRLLDLRLLHRGPVPDRRQPGAARRPRWRGRAATSDVADEPDQRHLPAPARPAGRRQGRAAGLPARREGDLRALHGRRRGAQDDVRHLPRGRPGARAVPQADDAASCTPSTCSPAAPTATRARCCATRCTPPPSPAARWRTPAG